MLNNQFTTVAIFRLSANYLGYLGLKSENIKTYTAVESCNNQLVVNVVNFLIQCIVLEFVDVFRTVA